jgi:Heme exporter protein D (CcmD)
VSAPAGVIAGGWEYVWAAYTVTAVILIGYAASLIARYRAERRRAARQGADEVQS